jgi:hypothetical protein
MATHLLHGGDTEFDVPAEWTERSRVVLEPIAAPSILGLFGFAGATFIVAAHLAGWYGGNSTALYLFPFAAIFGGLAQFIAGLYSYRARDGLGTAMHGMWGSFWLAYGVLYGFVAVGAIADPGTNQSGLGFWFFVLAAITLMGTVAALAENLALFTVLFSLSGGALCLAIGFVAGVSAWVTVGGYFLVVSAGLAFYTASAMMLNSSYNRTILPLGAPGAHDGAASPPRPSRTMYEPPRSGDAIPR